VASFTPQSLYPPGETALGTHWIGGWVNRRAGLDDLVRRQILPLPGLELRPQKLIRPSSLSSLNALLLLRLSVGYLMTHFEARLYSIEWADDI
jgi:hypothetical protein